MMSRSLWIGVALALGALGLVACGARTVDPARPQSIVDLSPTITEDLPVRLWGARALNSLGFRHSTEFERVVNEQGTYTQNSYWTLMNHGGPHLDAPNHMDPEAMGVDEYELEQLFGRAQVVDLRSLPRDKPIPRQRLESEGIEPGRIVLLLVGYSPPGTPDDYPAYPYLSKEAAEYLAELPVQAVGTDALGVECISCFFSGGQEGATGYEALLPVHHTFLPRGIPVFETLANLEALIEEEYVVFVGFPLKVEDGDGSPIRAAALVY